MSVSNEVQALASVKQLLQGQLREIQSRKDKPYKVCTSGITCWDISMQTVQYGDIRFKLTFNDLFPNTLPKVTPIGKFPYGEEWIRNGKLEYHSMVDVPNDRLCIHGLIMVIINFVAPNAAFFEEDNVGFYPSPAKSSEMPPSYGQPPSYCEHQQDYRVGQNVEVKEQKPSIGRKLLRLICIR